MSRVEELLHAFAAEFRAAGDADPRPYLRRVSGVDRAELAALIDHFVAAEPPPPFEPDAFAAFRREPARSALVDELLDAGLSLPEMRRATGLSKAQVGVRLAAKLELSGRESAVKGAYHDIETGQVPPERVRARIWDLLAELYAATAEQVRRAAGSAFEDRKPASSAMFTRLSSARDEPRAAEPPGDAAVRRAFFTD